MSPPFQERAEAGHAPPLTPHLCALPCAYIYEQVFGISITLLKRLLEYEGATLAASGSPRAILKEAYRFYDFIDEPAWLDMLRDRNTNVHIYDNKLAQDLIQRILNVYIPAFSQLRDGLMERYGELLLVPDDQFV